MQPLSDGGIPMQYQPPQQPQYPWQSAPQPPQPPGGRMTSRNKAVAAIVLPVFALLVVIIVAAAVTGGAGHKTTAGQTATGPVFFVVSGSSSAVSITYGDPGSQHEVQQPVGTPLTFSVPFSDAAYFAVTAQLQGDGTITCKVISGGHVVSEGHASGGFSICSAQASPDPGGGWTDEG